MPWIADHQLRGRVPFGLLDNIVRLDSQPQPIKQYYTRGVQTFRNMTPEGEAIASHDGEPTGFVAPDFDMALEDGLIFAFLNL